MTFALPLVLFAQGEGPSLAQINEWTVQRNVAEFQAHLVSPSEDLKVLNTNGVYGVGEKGWRALEGVSPDGTAYVVLTTAMTSEDVGELLFARRGDRLEYLPEVSETGWRIENHALTARFDLAARMAYLTDSFRLATSAEQAPRLRLSPQYQVRSIRTPSAKLVPFSQIGGVLLLPKGLGPTSHLVLTYEAKVDQPLYAGSITTKEATLTNDYWYPMAGRQPSTFSAAIQTPSGWLAVTNGDLLGVEKQKDFWTHRLRMALPIVYFSLSAGPYQKVFGPPNYWVMSPRMSSLEMQDQANLAKGCADFYRKTFGVWPFSGYGAVDSPAYGGGALEAYSYATYGGGLPELDAHEPAHTLFGGVLNNTYLKSMWNESFATFCEGFYDREGGSGNREDRRRAFIRRAPAQDAFNTVSCAAGSAFAGPDASEVGYGKGGLVLQMLEQLIGRNRLVLAIRNWLREHPKGKVAEWEDFRTHVFRVAPEPVVKRFWADWIERPGYAKYSVSKLRRTHRGLAFDLAFDGKPFVLPLDVLVLADGKGKMTSTVIEGPTTVELPGTWEGDVKVSVDPWGRTIRPMAEDGSEGLVARTRGLRWFAYPDSKSRMPWVRAPLETEPREEGGVVWMGDPRTNPRISDLLGKVGIELQGSVLQFRGQSVNLDSGGAWAMVDLGGGKQASVLVGTCRIRPNVGRAAAALFDARGQFLAGRVDDPADGGLSLSLTR